MLGAGCASCRHPLASTNRGVGCRASIRTPSIAAASVNAVPPILPLVLGVFCQPRRIGGEERGGSLLVGLLLPPSPSRVASARLAGRGELIASLSLDGPQARISCRPAAPLTHTHEAAASMPRWGEKGRGRGGGCWERRPRRDEDSHPPGGIAPDHVQGRPWSKGPAKVGDRVPWPRWSAGQDFLPVRRSSPLPRIRTRPVVARLRGAMATCLFWRF